jgi:hypothetical protein
MDERSLDEQWYDGKRVSCRDMAVEITRLRATLEDAMGELLSPDEKAPACQVCNRVGGQISEALGKRNALSASPDPSK